MLDLAGFSLVSGIKVLSQGYSKMFLLNRLDYAYGVDPDIRMLPSNRVISWEYSQIMLVKVIKVDGK